LHVAELPAEDEQGYAFFL